MTEKMSQEIKTLKVGHRQRNRGNVHPYSFWLDRKYYIGMSYFCQGTVSKFEEICGDQDENGTIHTVREAQLQKQHTKLNEENNLLKHNIQVSGEGIR